MDKSLINYLTYQFKISRLSVNPQFQIWAGSVSLSLLHIKAAYTLLMNVCDQSPLRLTMMQSQTLLTHRWCTFSERGRECVTFSFASKCGLYLIYERLHPIATQITHDAKTKYYWHTADFHFQDVARSLSLLFLIIKAANTWQKDNDVPNSIFCDYPYVIWLQP